MAEIFNGDYRDKNQQVVLEFFFSAHRSKRDIGELATAIKDADIFAPEGVGSEEMARDMDQLARGEAKPEEFDQAEGTFDAALFKIIYNSQIRLAFVDVPNNHPSEKEFEEKVGPLTEAVFAALMDGDLKKAIELQKKANYHFGKSQRSREDYIAEQLVKLYKNPSNFFPELKNKPNVKIFVSFGLIHRTLFDKLQKQFGAGTVILCQNAPTPFYGLLEEMLLGELRGESPTNDDVAYAKVLAEKLSKAALMAVSDDSILVAQVSRFVAEDLSFEQIQNLVISLEPSSILKNTNIKRFIANKFRALKIVLPGTIEAMEEMVKDRTVKSV